MSNIFINTLERLAWQKALDNLGFDKTPEASTITGASNLVRRRG